jgi:hypothetical protein
VGRLDFDVLLNYENYAKNVVEAEVNANRCNKVTFFGPEQDQGTNFLVTKILRPLADSTALEQPNWSVDTFLSDQATKENLSRILSGRNRSSLIFIGSHALRYRSGHLRQKSNQGAIICHEWPGLDAPAVEHYFSAEDIPDDADLRGMTVIQFGDSSAGVPHLDDFSSSSRREVSPGPFVSELAKRCLGISNGALSFIGHVDQVWTHSVQWQAAGPQLQMFEVVLRSLMNGARVGEAMKYFSSRYAQIAELVATALASAFQAREFDAEDLEYLWIARIDARNYILLGDPAVRVAMRGS